MKKFLLLATLCSISLTTSVFAQSKPILVITSTEATTMFNQYDMLDNKDDNTITNPFAISDVVKRYGPYLSEKEKDGLTSYGISFIQDAKGKKTNGMSKAEFNTFLNKLLTNANDTNDYY
jgi:hypothetical protein